MRPTLLATVISSGLTIIGTIVLVIFEYKNYKYQYSWMHGHPFMIHYLTIRKVWLRCIYYLCAADFSLVVIYCMDLYAPMTIPDSGSNSDHSDFLECKLQAALMEFCDILSIGFTTTITYQWYSVSADVVGGFGNIAALAEKYRYREIIAVMLVLFLATIATGALFLGDNIQLLDSWCWVARSPGGWKWWVWLYGPLVLSIFVNWILYLKMLWNFKTYGTVDNYSKVMSGGYVVVMMIIWIVPLINRMLYTHLNQIPPPGLQIAHAFLAPLQGFLNCIVSGICYFKYGIGETNTQHLGYDVVATSDTEDTGNTLETPAQVL